MSPRPPENWDGYRWKNPEEYTENQDDQQSFRGVSMLAYIKIVPCPLEIVPFGIPMLLSR